jgi:transcriptional activator HAC1
MSAPDDLYPSLFDTADDDTINPAESVMTPQSPGDCPTPGASGDSSDKKTKKRKSWGQVLPEPKTNLPPRKRAKTEDEKEQRRVERVLRNRRAAQSSRERKRQEVEALEHRCRQLEAALRSRDNTVTMLMEKLRRSEGGSRSPSPFDSLQPSPLTLSQPLFGSSSKDTPVEGDAGMMDDFVLMPESNNGTVNPASLSPELSPVPESKSTATAPAPAAPATASTSTDTTQHPAVSVSEGPAAVGGNATGAPAGAISLSAAPSAADSLLGDVFGMPSSLDFDSWGTQNQLSPSADPLNFEYDHLAGHSSPHYQEFDFEQFLSDDVSGTASGASAGNDSVPQDHPDTVFSLFDSENQVPQETFNQQPHTGASLTGCDDGVIAVGV